MITDDDLRAATAAGIIDEAQAARLGALAHQRAGRLARGLPEDEPFELFRGFAEIFVSLGLILLISSAVTFATAIGGVLGITLGLAGLCWFAGLYFTLNRRMTLPSIVLATGYAIGIGGFFSWILTTSDMSHTGPPVIAFGLLGIAAMLLHFRTFRVPFSMFLAGLFGLSVVFGFTVDTDVFAIFTGNWNALFDLRQGNSFAVATLVFGVLAFCAGLWFDLQDPHRVGRLARSAFWLHLLAAPALVNTVMMTAYNFDGVAGTILTVAGLSLVTVFALIIDRRSFLTAGLGYLAAVIFGFLEQGDGDLSIPTLMLVLGAIITYLGTFWTSLRVRLMRMLPDFPGKSRLPPYSENS
ncbi:hypothetical protein [Roseovarius aestuariivivens]|uniref:hypothetical protein n=1 Tax=Roseovarius aestuariivivens TaxID=1888910 RepID=UPI0010813D18|nr:hypothetical protein [Roseovarius aestuariivivens]